MGENCYRASQNINHGLYTGGIFFRLDAAPTPIAYYRLMIGAFVANQMTSFPIVDH